MTSFLSQLLLLLWKSWKTQIRSKGWMITQAVITIACLSLLAFIDNVITPATFNNFGQNFSFQAAHDDGDPFQYEKYICVNEANDPIVCSADINASILALDPEGKMFEPFQEGNVIELPPELSRAGLDFNFCDFTIRDFSQSSIDIVHNTRVSDCSPPALASRQFENLDQGHGSRCPADKMFLRIAKESGKFDKLEVKYLEPLKFKTNYNDIRSYVIGGSFTVPILFFCGQIAIQLAQETRSLIKDYLLSVGMSRILYFAHHFIFNFFKIWIPIIGCSVIMGNMFKYPGGASLGIHLFFVFTFALGGWISFSLMIGACFKKPGVAGIVTMLLLLVMAILPFIYKFNRTSYLCLLVSLLPNFAIQLFFDAKRESELRGLNIWFSEISEAVPQGYFMFMLIFDAFLYFFLAILIDYLRNSLENPLNLLMNRIESLRKNKTHNEEETKSLVDNKEKSDRQSSADLVIEGVHKIYSTGEHAVRGINMRMYKGQVSALLGHNGAGKSTTFSMISGMTVPTKGKIQIMEEESREKRQNLIGFCPQYNAIFPKLTVDEHLHFFARLKGVDSTNGISVLTALGMGDKWNAKAAELSGGMKRKLSIAIAFAANSPIILLDEPTAGMDTGARRDFERLLLERKKEHTILLTTHYTDEAELLADQIFIMARGKVFCSGSAQFLRKKFDSGFVLSFAVEHESDTERAVEAMMTVVQQFVPNVSLYKKRTKQFELKLSTDDTSRFHEMFEKIESRGPFVGMQSYGLSMNKLEQVFLKVGELTGTVDRTQEVETAMKELIQENYRRSDGALKWMRQFAYNLFKRLHYDIAHIISLVLSILVIFGLTYLLVRVATSIDPSGSGSSADLTDLLHTDESYRIAVDSSLHGNFDEIKRLLPRFGKHLTLHEVSSIPDWYKSNAASRPPVIGGLSRKGNEWTIFVHPRSKPQMTILEAIAAKINNPSLKKVNFILKKEEFGHSQKRQQNVTTGPNEVTKTAAIVVHFILSPLLIIRPIPFMVVERTSNFAHQELLTGANSFVFIFSSILYDFCLFIIQFVPLLGAFFVADEALAKDMHPQLIVLSLVTFLSGELIIRLMSRVFSTPAKGQIVIYTLLVLPLAMVVYVPLFVLEKASPGNGKYSPSFIFSPFIIVYKVWKETMNPILGGVYLFIHFFILLSVFALFEFRLITKIKAKRRMNYYGDMEMVQNGTDASKISSDPLVLRVTNLEKRYKDFTAVNGISFGVRAHECFGVLGVNGAGKTSTFEVLTGNALPDGGSATVGGVDCSTPATIGYCPQMDALIEDLSGRQSLVILAALHGYENPQTVADIVITCVGMQEHADKKSVSYSGGQRRKISVAASLLAQNSLIILDEPTAGIDPIARRDIWSVICALRESTNTAIVLTSHSMDEVEALVSNLIIMRTGSIVVEGSPQMIKNQFGDHYNFNLVMESASDVTQLTSQVASVFPTSILYDSASVRNIKFHIPRQPSDLFSEIYQKASNLAKDLNAIDFCFTQATLEDAFMLAATVKPESPAAAIVVPPSEPIAVPPSEQKSESKSKKGAEMTATDGSTSATSPKSATGI